MTWGMILKLYAGKEEKSIEIAKYKVINSERLEKILARFIEEQKEQLEEETRIYKDERVLRDFITHSTVFTFKRHLIHLGILSVGNNLFSGKLKEYIPEEDLWILN